MILKCSLCGRTIVRDLRKTAERRNMKKRGYRSYCSVKGQITFLKEMKKKKRKGAEREHPLYPPLSRIFQKSEKFRTAGLSL